METIQLDDWKISLESNGKKDLRNTYQFYDSNFYNRLKLNHSPDFNNIWTISLESNSQKDHRQTGQSYDSNFDNGLRNLIIHLTFTMTSA